VRAGEADVFHTRQQHTIKVAQVGRRLAQKCIKEQSSLAKKLGLDPEVVEAACLAHDLGHPPFGHAGEHVLQELTLPEGESFEGNAQSFRILTKLAVRFDPDPGLDLTRATLAAVLKYPWLREPEHPGRNRKWGAYSSEEDDFRFARELFNHHAKTTEADLMDWADDIAYSVHDLEDLQRVGLLPWHRILGGDHSDQIIERAVQNWFGRPTDAKGRVREALRRLEDLLKGTFAQLVSEPYEGMRHQRQLLRTLTSQLIGRYIHAAKLKETDEDGKSVEITLEQTDEVLVLKQITRDYIINNPSLAAQQRGQEQIIRSLFRDIMDGSSEGRPPRFLPTRLRYLWDIEGTNQARFTADCIASLTESEAVGLYARLHGLSAGSVLDPIVR